MAVDHEVDLYAPVKALLESSGFEVKSEIEHCDVLAMRGDEMAVVELKLRLNLDVILQAVNRQRMTEIVYIGIPRPGRAYFSARFRDICRLLRRLGIGLITVSATQSGARVDFEPKGAGGLPSRRNNVLIRSARREFDGRRGDRNTGGSTRKSIMTIYRQQALQVAALLLNGPSGAAALRRMGAPENAYDILHSNHYGWFVKRERGIYALTAEGAQAVGESAPLVAELLAARSSHDD